MESNHYIIDTKQVMYTKVFRRNIKHSNHMIRASMSEPHTSVTSLRTRVCTGCIDVYVKSGTGCTHYNVARIYVSFAT